MREEWIKVLIRGFLILAARRVGSCVLGGAFLWQVILRAGPQECEVVVHVTEPNVVIKVDGWDYPLEPRPGSPIVCDLRPGHHTLSMFREDRQLYREDFHLGPGDHVVLTARDQTRPVPPSVPLPALAPPRRFRP